MTVGGREAGHTSRYRGEASLHDGWSHVAQTYLINEPTSRGCPWKVCAGVSRSALSRLVTAGASQPTRKPRVPCGSYAGRVLFFLPVPSGLFHAGHVPGDRPCRRAGYGTRKARARGQPQRGLVVCNCRKKPFGFNAPTWERLCSQLFVFACLGLFPRERQQTQALSEPSAAFVE